ncbi:MAG: putative AlkP superfamily pyrophosphatase or phosphodiesterase [Sphingobacteriales bacterium]|jgi:predicted AlkP superfamily pyrophosphatase or phosphodiesterase
MKLFLSLVILFGASFISCQAQEKKPKLVIGIVVDQMRTEMLDRYQPVFGNDGFNRLLENGQFYANAQYDHIPTYTGPGHASIVTGSYPSVHGIVANDWYRRETGVTLNCVVDSAYQTLGLKNRSVGNSPNQMLSPTLADEMELASQGKSLTYSISIKDRSALFSGGFASDGSFWYEGSSGKFITSTFFMDETPKWLKTFNKKELALGYMTDWNLLYPAKNYSIGATSDDQPYEKKFPNLEKHVFPYKLKEITKDIGPTRMLASSPGGNTILVDLAEEIISSNGLGKDNITDFLSIGFSSPDYVGHYWGTYSMELMDIYARLDKDIARLLKFLDNSVGKDNYLIYLTADHGGTDPHEVLEKNKIPHGELDFPAIQLELEAFLAKKYGQGPWVLNISNDQVYINYQTINHVGIDLNAVADEIGDWFMKIKGIRMALSSYNFKNIDYTDHIRRPLQNGYYPGRSGDVLLFMDPNYMGASGIPTLHGSSFTYDRNVPLIFYGTDVVKGKSWENVKVYDIAPTVCAKVGVKAPAGSIGNVLIKVMSK